VPLVIAVLTDIPGGADTCIVDDNVEAAQGLDNPGDRVVGGECRGDVAVDRGEPVVDGCGVAVQDRYGRAEVGKKRGGGRAYSARARR
jgi:hypothetical protein